MTDRELEGRRLLVELAQQLMQWKGRALEVYGGLSVSARSRMDCVFLDSIDPAIKDLMSVAASQPAGREEDVETSLTPEWQAGGVENRCASCGAMAAGQGGAEAARSGSRFRDVTHAVSGEARYAGCAD